MFKQARACGKDFIKRQTSLLQRYGAEKSNVQVSASTGSKPIRWAIQSLDRIERSELAPRVGRQLEFCFDLPRHDGLMISVVDDEHRTLGKAA